MQHIKVPTETRTQRHREQQRATSMCFNPQHKLFSRKAKCVLRNSDQPEPGPVTHPSLPAGGRHSWPLPFRDHNYRATVDARKGGVGNSHQTWVSDDEAATNNSKAIVGSIEEVVALVDASPTRLAERQFSIFVDRYISLLQRKIFQYPFLISSLCNKIQSEARFTHTSFQKDKIYICQVRHI